MLEGERKKGCVIPTWPYLSAIAGPYPLLPPVYNTSALLFGLLGESLQESMAFLPGGEIPEAQR